MIDKEGMMEGDNTSLGPEQANQEREALLRQIESRGATITGLEQTVANKEAEITGLKQALGEADKKIADLETALSQAVASYKALVIKSNPGVLAELITGNSIDEVNASLKNARVIIDRVRQEMEAEASRTRVPAGAPQRSPLDLSVLSPREKIQYAIGGKK